MTRSLSLLSALALSSVSLLSLQPQAVHSMDIAFDCFERDTEKLVARSAVDMTSLSISCLPVPGSNNAGYSDPQNNDHDTDETLEATHTSSDDQPESWTSHNNQASSESWDEQDDEDDVSSTGSADNESWDQQDGQVAQQPSTGSQLGDAVGQHIGKLLLQGLNDLFN